MFGAHTPAAAPALQLQPKLQKHGAVIRNDIGFRLILRFEHADLIQTELLFCMLLDVTVGVIVELTLTFRGAEAVPLAVVFGGVPRSSFGKLFTADEIRVFHICLDGIKANLATEFQFFGGEAGVFTGFTFENDYCNYDLDGQCCDCDDHAFDRAFG